MWLRHGLAVCPIGGLVQPASPMYMHRCRTFTLVCDLHARVRLTLCSDRLQLAPENTMMSFNRSIACGVTAFETDVQLRYGGHGSVLTFEGSNTNTTAPLTMSVVLVNGNGVFHSAYNCIW